MPKARASVPDERRLSASENSIMETINSHFDESITNKPTITTATTTGKELHRKVYSHAIACVYSAETVGVPAYRDIALVDTVDRTTSLCNSED